MSKKGNEKFYQKKVEVKMWHGNESDVLGKDRKWQSVNAEKVDIGKVGFIMENLQCQALFRFSAQG